MHAHGQRFNNIRLVAPYVLCGIASIDFHCRKTRDPFRSRGQNPESLSSRSVSYHIRTHPTLTISRSQSHHPFDQNNQPMTSRTVKIKYSLVARRLHPCHLPCPSCSIQYYSAIPCHGHVLDGREHGPMAIITTRS
jgi:hypothetical protein